MNGMLERALKLLLLNSNFLFQEMMTSLVFKRFYECIDIRAFQQSLESNCMAVPYWFMIMESISR